MICPTVIIETKNGPVIINAEDFDKKEHKIFDPSPKTIKDISTQLRLWGVIFDTTLKLPALKKIYAVAKLDHAMGE